VKWVAYIGAFFNKEFAANAIYNSVRTEYLRLRRSAKAQRGTPPLVCWVYKDWDGDYAMSYSKYKVEYVSVSGCGTDGSCGQRLHLLAAANRHSQEVTSHIGGLLRCMPAGQLLS
jgi:hypothetical protein